MQDSADLQLLRENLTKAKRKLIELEGLPPTKKVKPQTVKDLVQLPKRIARFEAEVRALENRNPLNRLAPLPL